MKKKRILSWLLTAALALSLLPSTALADVEEGGGDASEEQIEYVLMNIPYEDFYQAEVKNNVKVDAVSSATLNKTRTATLVGGSYHVNSDGSDITGITFPVKVGEGVDLSDYKRVTDQDRVTIEVTNRGQTSSTTYEGREALFENASYAYYVLAEEPAYYKEVTADEDGGLSFGKIQGQDAVPVTLNDVGAELLTESSYGDYQINLDDDTLSKAGTIYGIVLHTENGSYGLRHLENIWRNTSLAFCTGFTVKVHNSPTSSAHYVSIMGETITGITYYTDGGIYEITTNLYVPIKTEHAFAVADAAVTAGETSVTTTGLDDYDSFVCSNAAITYQADTKTLTWTAAEVLPGTYTLTASDTDGKYAPVSTSFTLSSDTAAARYDADGTRLAAAENVAEGAFANYLKNITSVSVNGKAYAASGRGAVAIVDPKTGAIDLNAASGGSPIFKVGDNTVTVTATGYPALTFTLTRRADGSESAPYEIKTAEDLSNIRNDLSAYYKLAANIDLSEYENWEPIGTFVPAADSETGEDPDPAYAFTGVFDGDGHTISGLTVSGNMLVGLFGCVSGGTVKNVTIQNASVSGGCMAAAAVGYAYNAVVENVKLTADGEKMNTIQAVQFNVGTGDEAMTSAPNMVAGIVGAGMDSTITNCTVENTALTATGFESAEGLGSNVHDIGLVGGGLEGCTLTGCSAKNSTVTVTGPYAFGVGGLSGCAMASDTVKDCTVENVTIQATGSGAYLVGGLVGYAGLTDGETTKFSNCSVSDVQIVTGENAARVGGLIGGGFYLEIYKDYFPVPTSYTIDSASSVVNTTITTGENSAAVGAVAGHAYCSEVNATATGVEINDTESNQTCGINEDTASMTVIVDGKDVSGQIYAADLKGEDGSIDLSKLDLTNTAIFADGKAGAYLVTVGTNATQLVGDTSLARWTGVWESWQNFIYPDASTAKQYPYLDEVWELAYKAYIAAFQKAGADDITEKMPDVAALKAYWNNIATTRDVEQIKVAQTEDGYQLTWLDKNGGTLAEDTYVMTGKMLKGFEGAAAYVFTAQNLGADSPYRYLVAMEPGLDGTEETPIAAHYHFQFGSDLEDMLLKGELYNSDNYGTNPANGRPLSSNLTNTQWYATVIDSGATALAKYNVILGMHMAEKWSKLPESGSSDRPSGGSGGSGSSGYAVSMASSVKNGKVTISPRNADKGDTVTLTVTPDAGYVLDTLTVTDKNGKEIALTDKGSGKYTFTMPASQVSVKATFKPAETAAKNGFTDVAAGAYYADAVQWAVEQGITNGTTATTFTPGAACTRGQIVTFLWRAMGSPEPSNTAASFTDVAPGTYYDKAVQWAVEQGITNGTTATTFAPDATVTRGQTVTFLWRAAGKAAASGTSFADVASDAYYAEAVAWAVEQGITQGTTTSTFSPAAACTRGQIVTFLYRYLAD